MFLKPAQQQIIRTRNIFVFPILLLVAQASIIFAILSFGSRTGGHPLSPTGLILGGISIFISGVYFLYRYFYLPDLKPTQTVAILFIPAMVSLILAAAMWMTPWMSGAPYAPFKPGAADTVLFWNLLFVILSSIIGVVYQSRNFLIGCLIFQSALYMGTYSFLHWHLFPYLNFAEGILGPRPETLIIIVGGYIFALFILPWRKKMIKFQPSWKFVTISTNLVGGWIAYVMLTSLPQNGDYLGWQSVPLTVPENAWNWSFTFSQIMIAIAMVAPIAVVLFIKGRNLKLKG